MVSKAFLCININTVRTVQSESQNNRAFVHPVFTHISVNLLKKNRKAQLLRSLPVGPRPAWGDVAFLPAFRPCGSPGFHPALPIYRPYGTGETYNETHIGGGIHHFYRHAAPTGLGTPAHHLHLLFKPRRGAISVDTTRHPSLFKLRRSGIMVTPGDNPASGFEEWGLWD